MRVVKRADWSREEVEAIVADYFAMLEFELSGVPFRKTEHRKRLRALLPDRSEGSVEFKHQNISAVLIDLGFPYISGYLPRFNYQERLLEVVSERLAGRAELIAMAARDAEVSSFPPTVDDILEALRDPPPPDARKVVADRATRRYSASRLRLGVNYLEVEARNRSLGAAGEEFVVRFEQARLLRAGRADLALRIDHVARTQGDGAGFDVLSFDEKGAEQFIEVKTTKYGRETPFLVSRNEVEVSRECAEKYHLYRVFDFRRTPHMFRLLGSLSTTCELDAVQYVGTVG